MELHVADDLVPLAAGFIAERAREAGGAFRIALAGGSTPRAVYEALAELELDWSAWHVWWGDDRQVPPDHPDSNERMAR
jgi:6-phosphogluconolactonase